MIWKKEPQSLEKILLFFCQGLEQTVINKPIISQLIMSELKIFWKEAQELTFIFQKITSSLKIKN